MQVCAGALGEKCGYKQYIPLSGPKSRTQDWGLGDTCAPGLRKDFDISIF